MNDSRGGSRGRSLPPNADPEYRPGPPPKRTPPPDVTGNEAAYLAKLREAKTPVAVELLDGEVVRGWVEYYDRDMIKINRHSGPNVFVRKKHIRFLQEDLEG